MHTRLLQGDRGHGGYGITADANEVDLLAFRNLPAAGRARLRGGDPAGAVEKLQLALAEWRGPMGEDVPQTRFLTAIGAAINVERLATTEGLGQALIASGRHDEAVAT